MIKISVILGNGDCFHTRTKNLVDTKYIVRKGVRYFVHKSFVDSLLYFEFRY